MAKKLTIEELGVFAASKGFIYGPEPEIYNGLAGFYTYGPLGKRLKNNVEEAIRKTFLEHEMWEVECPTIMPSEVWEASGHLGGFSDLVIDCSKCKASFRVDKLIEDNFGVVKAKDKLKFLKGKNFRCPSCSSIFIWKLKKHELMMKTVVGMDIEAYNRPETATTTYLPFNRYVSFFRDKLPFGVFQIGKAYRNELSPRQNVFRGREFTQAEGQIFLLKDYKHGFEKFKKVKNKKLPLFAHNMKKVQDVKLSDALKKKYIKSEAYGWCLYLAYELFLNMGISKEFIRLRQHGHDEKAFYAEDAWDIEVEMKSLGWVEMCGVHDRSDYDLKQHEEYSKKKLRFNKERVHILEVAFGTDRPCLALLDRAYEDDKKRGNIVLKLDAKMAPVQVGVFPLVNKLKKESHKLYLDLKKEFLCVFDSGGSVGRRYARADEIGIPFCVTFDFDSLKDKKVTVRDIRNTKQVRVKIKDLGSVLCKLIKGEKLEKVGKIIK